MQRVVRIQREGEKTRAIVFALEAALALASSFSLPHWNEMDDPFSLFFFGILRRRTILIIYHAMRYF